MSHTSRFFHDAFSLVPIAIVHGSLQTSEPHFSSYPVAFDCEYGTIVAIMSDTIYTGARRMTSSCSGHYYLGPDEFYLVRPSPMAVVHD